MSVFDWILVALFTFAACSTILLVGKPRKPITPGSALITTIVDAALIVGLLVDRGVLHS